MERPTPEQHKEFELMTREFISHEYPDYNGHFTLYGRNGQRQYGCDVKDQAGTLIVQCKCYDNYDPKSADTLVAKTKGDYEKACGKFHDMELFVVCTTLSRSTDTDNKLKELRGKFGRDVEIDTYFWEDIEAAIHNSHTANKSYADEFEAPLFLHNKQPGGERFCLKNLFVPQKYRVTSDKEVEWISHNDLFDHLAGFVANSEKSFLIAEGDAGCGKTSLVQSLCYHYRENDTLAKKVFRGRPLVTVRLRDVDKELITKERGLLPALADYLGLKNRNRSDNIINELNRRFPNAVLVLDGFDELCIMEGIQDYDRLIYRLFRERLNGWKFIIVSRPNYLRSNIDVPHISIELEHFDREKRREWMRSYTDPDICGGAIEDSLREFILQNNEEGLSDTPLTLYLLAAGGVEEKDRNNLWRLYNRIFSKEINERRYDTGDHPGAEYAEASYRLAELVAHEIYLTGNERLYVDAEQLEKIASRLPEKYAEEREALAKHCLALSCYWKMGERGMAEFYHNNIRDFFLCEMIWRGVSDIYSDRKLSDDDKCEKLIAFFRDNFRRGALAPKVVEFIQLRAEACKEDKTPGFPACEAEQKLLPVFFEKMLTDGRVYNCLNEENLLLSIASIILCVMGFYQAASVPFLSDGERLCWYYDVRRVNTAHLLKTSLSGLLCQLSNDLSFCSLVGIDLTGAKLSSVKLTGADLTHANLTDANLTRANLTDVNLTRANLTRANLKSANLTGADLRNANLTHTDLTYTHLNEANLRNDNLTHADLTYADLTYADLTGTDLKDTHLAFANLTRANLTRANLTGANLTSANLTGAVLVDGNVQYANLTRAHLQYADLTGAILWHAHLMRGFLTGADLTFVHLTHADLTGTDLTSANLTSSILRDATLPDGFTSSDQDEQVAHLKSMDIEGLII